MNNKPPLSIYHGFCCQLLPLASNYITHAHYTRLLLLKKCIWVSMKERSNQLISSNMIRSSRSVMYDVSLIRPHCKEPTHRLSFLIVLFGSKPGNIISPPGKVHLLMSRAQYVVYFQGKSLLNSISGNTFVQNNEYKTDNFVLEQFKRFVLSIIFPLHGFSKKRQTN